MWLVWCDGHQEARGILIRSLDKISGRRRVESVMEVKLQVCNNPLHTILYLVVLLANSLRYVVKLQLA